MEVKTSIFILCVGVLFVLGIFLGLAIGKVVYHEGYYKDGQLDCQRGVIRYELTDNGYIEHVELD